ncbi:MAG: hypothetical protein IT461_04620 [Planctomycetes bacterium]|nr:hypothetical protein [Planctomycetota bacterium]
MLAAFDFGPWGTLAIIFVGVVVFLVVQAAKAQEKKRANLRPHARVPQRYQPPPMPRLHSGKAPRPVVAAPPMEDVDSDEATEVAENLAQGYLEVAQSKTLVKPEEKAVAAKPVFSLRDADDIRRAFILNEVLGKPKAMRKR